MYGWVALRATSRWIWFGATLGGLATIAALAISLGAVRLRVVLPEYFGLLVAGSPALIPLTHLALERIFRKPANPQLERSQVGVVTRR